MIKLLRSNFTNLLAKTHNRSRGILKNIFLSFGIKIGSILVSFALVPLTINYISPIEYGIWLTVSSLINWMNFFDIGLGNGLRNSLSSSLATNDHQMAKKYVSTTYASLTIISVSLSLIFSIIIPHVDWRSFLNIPNDVPILLNRIIFIVAYSFCLQFVVQLINTILIASHKTATASLISFIGQILVLIVTVILTRAVPGSLSILVWVLTSIPIIVFIAASIYLFRTSLKNISPQLKEIDFKHAKRILHIGGYFFIIQIGALILFQTDNIIITKLFGPSYVTTFNISYKLFSSITMIFSIIVAPYWSAFTDAYTRMDFVWMKKSISSLRKVFYALTILSVILYFISPFLYKIWVGDKIRIETRLSLAMLVYIICYMWQTIHVYFLNGVGKIKLQLILVLASAVLNIPLSIYLGKKFGLSGVTTANTLVFIVMSIVFSIQTQKIINRTAHGIWNK